MREQLDQLAEFVQQDIPLFADLDDCIIGVICRKSKYYAVYSKTKIIKHLMNENGWSYLDAIDWFEFNIEFAYGGPQSPLILIDEFPDGVGDLM